MVFSGYMPSSGILHFIWDSYQSPLWHHWREGINSPVFDLSFFALFLSWQEPELFFLGSRRAPLSALFFSLSHPWIMVFSHSPACRVPRFVCWVWPKASQAYMNSRGQICLPNPSAPFHWANLLEGFYIYLCELREEGVPWEFAPWGFCRLPLCLGLDKGLLGSEPTRPCARLDRQVVLFLAHRPFSWRPVAWRVWERSALEIRPCHW